MRTPERRNIPQRLELDSMEVEKVVVLLEGLRPETAHSTRSAIIDAIMSVLSGTAGPTVVKIDIQAGVWTSAPTPTYLPPGKDVEFINDVAGKDLLLLFTAGAHRLSDPEFVIPAQGSRIISVSGGCKVTAVAHLWMRNAGQVADDWEKVNSGTGNGADMQIDDPP